MHTTRRADQLATAVAPTPSATSRATPKGLSEHAASLRRARDGPNELPATRRRSPAAIAASVIREPMFMMLIAAAAIYFVLGDRREALILGASVFVIMAITYRQERKTERALEALRDLASPRALVLRDGEWKRVAGRDVVLGDVLQVREGDRVPADATLLDGGNVSVDESMLTGESVPVHKRPARDPASDREPGDDGAALFSATLVTQGVGVAVVTATGPATAIGRIGKALVALAREPSGLERETRRAVVVFAAIGLALCVAVTIAFVVTRGAWLEGLLAGITLAMANLPEEFPVVLTVFLALGAWRISRRGVLTRRPAAIETLGATTVLCVDKTGTLTENRMAVEEVWTLDDAGRAPHPASGLAAFAHYGALASEPTPFDPMDQALQRHAEPRPAGFADTANRVHSYPLTPDQLSVAHIWLGDDPDGDDVAVKGAPEAVAELCSLNAGQRATIEAAVVRMASAGLRVIAVAAGTVPRDRPWPTTQHGLRLRFLGLAGLADPVRPAVPQALAECYAAGIRTVMITGDYPVTARAIAAQIGLREAASVVTGEDIGRMDAAELMRTVSRVNVFARVVPEQKLRLVQALKAAGEIVAMTGDGVNDAPALKAAHIGVAMGRRGSDVAREAASLVLLEDDFGSLVDAVRIGRRIYANIASAMRYIIAVHVPTAGMALAPLLFGWPLVLFPVHIVFLEFVIDPACSIVFEAEPAERDAMRRPPRAAASRLFTAPLIATSVLQGLFVLAPVAWLYGAALSGGAPGDVARAMAFAALVFGNIGLVFANRTRSSNAADVFDTSNATLLWLVGGALGGLALALYVDPVREVFGFAAISAAQLGSALVAGCAGLCALAGLRAMRRGLSRAAG